MADKAANMARRIMKIDMSEQAVRLGERSVDHALPSISSRMALRRES